jgi:hypothetical protein
LLLTLTREISLNKLPNFPTPGYIHRAHCCDILQNAFVEED